MLYNIAHLKQVPLPESTPSLSDTMRTFLSHALNTDPSVRPNAMELLAMINTDPSVRPNAMELLAMINK